MSYVIKYYYTSHIGKCRKTNQDNLYCNGNYLSYDNCGTDGIIEGTLSPSSQAVFAVFDGMGGEECGEIASYIAAKEASVTPLGEDGILDLSSFCKRANDKICDYAESNSISAMGTTAAILLFSKDVITLCNIGDSKIFRYSDGEMEQISKDHVVVAAFGKKPPLSQNLGIPKELLVIEPYLSQGRYKNGDRYLICSDGLTDMVPPDEIADVLENHPIEAAASVLVDKALENGGKDNVTIILLEVKQIKNKLLNLFNNKTEE